METKKEIIDYLQCIDMSIGFQDLYDNVIGKDACVLCGACISICPRIGMKSLKPVLVESDPECSLCFKYCARTYFPEEMFEKEIFKSKIPKDYLLGHYQKIVAARSSNKEILNVAQNGGIVTNLLIHALNIGLIDGVLLVTKDENWIPKPFIARTPQDVLSVAGSIYSMAPTLFSYNDAVNKYKLKKLAFVGMPCQIQAARKIQLWPPLSEEYGKISLIIGLYCTSNYSYDLMKELVEEKLDIPLKNVEKFDISKSEFIIHIKEGIIKKVPIQETKRYNWPSCQYCKDYTAEFADISVGSVGKPAGNWNSVIVRSDVGKELFNHAIKEKKITISKDVDITKIKKEALKKKSKIKELDEKVFSAIRFLNISDKEIKTYAILVSLGYANLQLLSRIMKIDESEIKINLNLLKERGWIENERDFYKPTNPTKVIKDEIYKFKREFQQNIERIKNEALTDLETLFIQNNLMNVRYKHFMDQIYERVI
ncbi:MAG: Coenzyme F420 hydrogenase/dehydrogenase, beta subunit C-terminal domain [Candidatus Lokiarchaeota archaeon]|nr:Coenzyme F420 hydrogenase/dehydrogenase, beta subunit C-terminal domain [Candidatus Lokiarchaeota archaeon]